MVISDFSVNIMCYHKWPGNNLLHVDTVPPHYFLSSLISALKASAEEVCVADVTMKFDGVHLQFFSVNAEFFLAFGYIGQGLRTVFPVPEKSARITPRTVIPEYGDCDLPSACSSLGSSKMQDAFSKASNSLT